MYQRSLGLSVNRRLDAGRMCVAMSDDLQDEYSEVFGSSVGFGRSADVLLIESLMRTSTTHRRPMHPMSSPRLKSLCHRLSSRVGWLSSPSKL